MVNLPVQAAMVLTINNQIAKKILQSDIELKKIASLK